MLRPFEHPVACCWLLLRVVAQSLKPVKLFSQQLPTFLLFRDRRSVVQQCWIRLHSSSNIVGATNAHYAWCTKRYGLYPSHDALQVPTLMGVVASVCRPLPTRTQQFPTLLAEECWELLRPFACSLTSNVRFEFVGFTRGVECIIHTAVVNIGARGAVPPVAPNRTGSGRDPMLCTGNRSGILFAFKGQNP